MIRREKQTYKRRRNRIRDTKIRKQKTTRHCQNCKKQTTFQYNKNIGHSECTKCGWRVIKL